MRDTFHHFSKLPGELRDEIWSLAVEPTRPGAHVFPLYDPKQGDKGVKPPKRETWNAILRRQYEFWKGDLRLNEGYKSKGGDDGGMWTACKESRFMMEKHTKGLLETYFDNELTTYFTYRFPPANFFYLVPIPHELDTVVKNHGHRGTAFDDLVDRGIRQSSLVIECSPEWGLKVARTRFSDINYSQLVRAFTSPIAYLHCLETIWFVDYNIKRIPYVPREEECKGSDVIFCTGDRRFLDVSKHPSKWDLQYRNKAGVDVSIYPFLLDVEYAINYQMTHLHGMDRCDGCWVDILACEYI